MAGIYIHIPFCRKQCYYCDFHFTVSLKQKYSVLAAIKKEIESRRIEFSDEQFNTLYFGGGTPSILSVTELNSIIELIKKNYNIIPEAEITLEANPDDLSLSYLSALRKESIINRLSIGIQSFHDKTLEFLNRSHNSEDAYASVKLAKKLGFENLNIDLIYGIPGMEEESWQKNLDIFKTLEIPHLSAYHLTIEPKTVFAYYLKKGKINIINEEESLTQFRILMQFAKNSGYEHYEISNFAKPGYESKHNLSYWNREPYIGIGPSAHSFYNDQRRWNIANNTKYCHSVLSNSNDYFEFENIDKMTAYNEYLMTSLRMQKGISAIDLGKKFGIENLSIFKSSTEKFIKQKLMVQTGANFYLSDDGKFLTDYIISELMMVK